MLGGFFRYDKIRGYWITMIAQRLFAINELKQIETWLMGNKKIIYADWNPLGSSFFIIAEFPN